MTDIVGYLEVMGEKKPPLPVEVFVKITDTYHGNVLDRVEVVIPGGLHAGMSFTIDDKEGYFCYSSSGNYISAYPQPTLPNAVKVSE
jgi:hypothetical protein